MINPADRGSEFSVFTRRQVLENKKMHRKKLYETRPAIDNSLPVACKHPLVKSKKELLIEGKSITVFIFHTLRISLERCTEIEKANRILLQKMTKILSGPATHMKGMPGLGSKHAQSVNSVKPGTILGQGLAKFKTNRAKINQDSSARVITGAQRSYSGTGSRQVSQRSERSVEKSVQSLGKVENAYSDRDKEN
jgi:hypothetical protein